MSEQTGYFKTDPPSGFVNVTARDTDFSPAPNSLWIGGAGNLAVMLKDGTTGTLTGIPAGTHLRMEIKQILTTGTTATAILGFKNR